MSKLQTSGAKVNANVLVDSLQMLRDIDGVVGSFLVGVDGAVLARDVPRILEEQTIADVGVRLVRLEEALGDLDDTLLECRIRYADYDLHLRKIPQATLAIVTSGQANIPALRMGLNLVARRIAPQLGMATIEGVNELPGRWESAPPSSVPPVSGGGSTPRAAASSRESAPSFPISAPMEAANPAPPAGAVTVRMYRGRKIP